MVALERSRVRVACRFHTRELQYPFQQLPLEMVRRLGRIAGLDQRGLRLDLEFDWVTAGWLPTAQASERYPRQTAGARAPHNRDRERLHQHLAEYAPAAGSDRHTDGNLAPAVRRARREQAAKI